MIELLWCKKNPSSLWLIAWTIDTDKSFYDIYSIYFSSLVLATIHQILTPNIATSLILIAGLSCSINYHKLLFNESIPSEKNSKLQIIYNLYQHVYRFASQSKRPQWGKDKRARLGVQKRNQNTNEYFFFNLKLFFWFKIAFS